MNKKIHGGIFMYQEKSFALLNLPDEIILNVYSNLEPIDIQKKISVLNHKNHEITNDNLLWLNYINTYFHPWLDIEAIKQIRQKDDISMKQRFQLIFQALWGNDPRIINNKSLIDKGALHRSLDCLSSLFLTAYLTNTFDTQGYPLLLAVLWLNKNHEFDSFINQISEETRQEIFKATLKNAIQKNNLNMLKMILHSDFFNYPITETFLTLDDSTEKNKRLKEIFNEQHFNVIEYFVLQGNVDFCEFLFTQQYESIERYLTVPRTLAPLIPNNNEVRLLHLAVASGKPEMVAWVKAKFKQALQISMTEDYSEEQAEQLFVEELWKQDKLEQAAPTFAILNFDFNMLENLIFNHHALAYAHTREIDTFIRVFFKYVSAKERRDKISILEKNEFIDKFMEIFCRWLYQANAKQHENVKIINQQLLRVYSNYNSNAYVNLSVFTTTPSSFIPKTITFKSGYYYRRLLQLQANLLDDPNIITTARKKTFRAFEWQTVTLFAVLSTIGSIFPILGIAKYSVNAALVSLMLWEVTSSLVIGAILLANSNPKFRQNLMAIHSVLPAPLQYLIDKFIELYQAPINYFVNRCSRDPVEIIIENPPASNDEVIIPMPDEHPQSEQSEVRDERALSNSVVIQLEQEHFDSPVTQLHIRHRRSDSDNNTEQEEENSAYRFEV